jgi:hypothetical protein
VTARLLAALGLALVGAILGLILPVLWTISALLGPSWVPDPRGSLLASLVALIAPVWCAVNGFRLGWAGWSPEERQRSRERKQRQQQRLRERQQQREQGAPAVAGSQDLRTYPVGAGGGRRGGHLAPV